MKMNKGLINLTLCEKLSSLGYEMDLVNSGFLWYLIESSQGQSIRTPSSDGTTNDGAIIFIRGSIAFIWINDAHLPNLDNLVEIIKENVHENTPENAKVYKIKDDDEGESLNLEFKFNDEFHEFRQYYHNGDCFMTYCKGPEAVTITNVELIKIDKFDEDLLKKYAMEMIENVQKV